MNAASYDRAHWARGGALAEAKIEKPALEVFPELKGKDSLYQKFWQGPLMVKGDKDLPPFVTLLRFVSDIYHRKPEAKGATPGKSWLIRSLSESPFRVVLSSGHPEQTPGSRYFTPRMVRWLARKPIVRYKPYMNPFKYDKELMYDQEWRKGYRENVSTLLHSQNPQEIGKALKTLASEIHRAAWFVPGFLRSRDPHLRELAAELVVDLQVFWAQEDVEAAYSSEVNPEVRKKLKKTLQYLSPSR